ncbi:TPA: transcription termination/antitermination NusG family protein [Escherichia coli]
MRITLKTLTGQQWYLARYNTTGKNRELLFGWLSDQFMTPWTPLRLCRIRRTDKVHAFRMRVQAVFPGYFFLKVNLAEQSAAGIRRHSAFIDFVTFGTESEPVPVSDNLVRSLMHTWPDPSLNPAAAAELNDAADVRLSRTQYHWLMALEDNPQPAARISMLLELVGRGDIPRPDEQNT